MTLSHDIMTQVMISPTLWEGKASSPPVPLSGPHPLSPSPVLTPCPPLRHAERGDEARPLVPPLPKGEGDRTRWRRGGQGEDPRGVRRGRACHASHFPWPLSVTPVTAS